MFLGGFGLISFVGRCRGFSPSAPPPTAPPAAAVAALSQFGISVPSAGEVSHFQGSPAAYAGAVQVPVAPVASGAPPAYAGGVPPPVVVMGKVVEQGEVSQNEVAV